MKTPDPVNHRKVAVLTTLGFSADQVADTFVLHGFEAIGDHTHRTDLETRLHIAKGEVMTTYCWPSDARVQVAWNEAVEADFAEELGPRGWELYKATQLRLAGSD